MKFVIVGGVAGGMSAATRLRRLNEDAEIIVLEKGPYVSFANCGLPYYIGGVIQNRSALLVQTAEKLYDRFRLDVRIESEVLKIDRQHQKVTVNHQDYLYDESYDKLILSTGAKPVVPPMKGAGEADNLYTLRDVPDAERIVQMIETNKTGRAVIVGAGFIGLEMAENLYRRGLKVTVIERAGQILPPLDIEMAAAIERELVSRHIRLFKGRTVTGFEDRGATVVMDDGRKLETDLTILSVGVRPESALAADAGLELGTRQAIVVNDRLQTSDPNIYAIGDAISVRHFVSGTAAVIPLASPANRQGRMVADILSGIERHYAGTLGTSIVRVFDQAAAVTGLNEKQLQGSGIAYETVHTSPYDHATYYPGSQSMQLKLLFESPAGRLLGAQAVGEQGVDKTIDVLSTAIKAKMTVYDLTELELAYAPPFNSAKSPVNMLGYVSQNILEHKVYAIQWNEVDQRIREGSLLIDVRTKSEYEQGTIPGAANIPLDSLRERIDELPRHKEIIVACRVGLRGYLAARILSQKGYKVKNLDGGYKLYSTVFSAKNKKEKN
ncbi:FAD-dependent oxidoreductase [Sporolactobacillus sp. CQH2019]|uniref:FAD-dependent oxidoreductase n=1 Tax=Sporolactobacillus sp. CQH2019 TaxID=3023512 RepID=UPI002367A9C5|nr:FAD-dependent oxidoreductase [Sporolactobacillus sp. CQH2019]MDD9149122.1 FAD-dependent oxidoreductase [Sporolactobacillus sp. CQH2019]